MICGRQCMFHLFARGFRSLWLFSRLLPCCTLCSGIKKEKLLNCSQENTRLNWKQLLECGERLGGASRNCLQGKWERKNSWEEREAKWKWEVWFHTFYFYLLHPTDLVIISWFASNKQNFRAKKLNSFFSHCS